MRSVRALLIIVTVAMLAASCSGGSDGSPPQTSSSRSPSGSSTPTLPKGQLTSLPGVTLTTVKAAAAAVASEHGLQAGPEHTVNITLKTVGWNLPGKQGDTQSPSLVLGWYDGHDEASFLECVGPKTAVFTSSLFRPCLQAPITGSNASAVQAWLRTALRSPQVSTVGVVLCGAGWAWRVSTAGSAGTALLTVGTANPLNAQEGKCARTP